VSSGFDGIFVEDPLLSYSRGSEAERIYANITFHILQDEDGVKLDGTKVSPEKLLAYLESAQSRVKQLSLILDSLLWRTKNGESEVGFEQLSDFLMSVERIRNVTGRGQLTGCIPSEADPDISRAPMLPPDYIGGRSDINVDLGLITENELSVFSAQLSRFTFAAFSFDESGLWRVFVELKPGLTESSTLDSRTRFERSGNVLKIYRE